MLLCLTAKKAFSEKASCRNFSYQKISILRSSNQAGVSFSYQLGNIKNQFGFMCIVTAYLIPETMPKHVFHGKINKHLVSSKHHTNYNHKDKKNILRRAVSVKIEKRSAKRKIKFDCLVM